MVLATAFLSGMHSLVRFVSAELHPFEIAFFRNLFGLAAIMPLVLGRGLGVLRSRQPGVQLLRGLFGAVSMLTWFYGLSVVPFAQATALSFTAVVFSAVGAVLVFGEKMRLRRWTAVCFGFVGALVILRPGLVEVGPGAWLILLSALAWAGNILAVKRLSRTDSAVAIVVWLSFLLTVITFFPALAVWRWPTLAALLWLGLLGTLGSAGHLALAQALKLCDTTAVMPLDFTRLVWASVIGHLAFAETPDLWTWVGGATIIGSASYIAWREARLKGTGTVGGVRAA